MGEEEGGRKGEGETGEQRVRESEGMREVNMAENVRSQSKEIERPGKNNKMRDTGKKFCKRTGWNKNWRK